MPREVPSDGIPLVMEYPKWWDTPCTLGLQSSLPTLSHSLQKCRSHNHSRSLEHSGATEPQNPGDWGCDSCSVTTSPGRITLKFPHRAEKPL